jgi:N-acetylmuramoyl-L-alanine amidase
MRRCAAWAALAALAAAAAGCGGDDLDVPRAGTAPDRAATAPPARPGDPQPVHGGAEGTPPPRPRGAPRPPILQWRIPFPERRRRETAAYARRHYGIADWRLRQVRHVVQHFSVTSTARAVYETFRRDRPDPELGLLPGTCAHFVISPRGTIYQLVDLGTMCRHVYGLNHVSVGIEHVGYSDAQVMGNARQLAASLALTRWLRCGYGLPVAGVIGHAEALRSPWYRDLPRRPRQTHGDFRRATMDRYRALLARRPCR